MIFVGNKYGMLSPPPHPFFFLDQYLAENRLTAGVALYYLKKKTREKGHTIFNNFIEQKYTNKGH